MQTVVIQFFQPSPQQAAVEAVQQPVHPPVQPAAPGVVAQFEAEVMQAVTVIRQPQSHHKVITAAQMQATWPISVAAAVAVLPQLDKQVQHPKVVTVVTAQVTAYPAQPPPMQAGAAAVSLPAVQPQAPAAPAAAAMAQ
jgi:hypothetical protein